jgi:aryl-alcohol dehydrogenase-like predicted oxidoreductase
MCLGAMTFGEDWGIGADAATSKRLIDLYLDRGGNFFDTANFYNNGTSEQILGEYFETTSQRQSVVIATKFSGNLHPGDPNGGGAGAKSVFRACEESLRRLRTDYIDLYWLHWYDTHTPIEETMRALDDLVRGGKVRYIGFSDTPAWKTAEAHVLARCRGWTPLIALQVEYSLMERTVEHEFIPLALDMHFGVTPWSPLRMGALSGKYRRDSRAVTAAARSKDVTQSLNEPGYRIIDAVIEIARSHETTAARVALAWLMSRPAVTAPIIGARTIAQLEDNLGAIDLKLKSEDLVALDAVSRCEPVFPAGILLSSYPLAMGGLTINGRSYADPAKSPPPG